MARSNIVLILVIASMVVGCSTSANLPRGETAAQPATETAGKRIASADVVKAVPEPVEITGGGSGEGIVRLSIQSGYHVNANPPTYPYLIATALEVAPAAGISAGPIIYPPPINTKFPFAEKPIAVYEGETQIRTTLRADKTAKPGEYSLTAKLRIQACDNQVCYPPGTRDLAIPVIVK